MQCLMPQDFSFLQDETLQEKTYPNIQHGQNHTHTDFLEQIQN